jgi:cytochrome c oxidase assembly protein subunit 15
MPFDPALAPPSAAPASGIAAMTPRHRRLVSLWLFATAFMILVMVALGGATRLTGSGLSIMEWAPLAGILPPVSHAEWERLFHLYQEIPQYKLLNQGFGLAGFQNIFWLEWSHRLWGRLIGLVFFIPLVVFAARGMIPRRLIPRLALLFVLGGLQGAVGWFMVASGFFPDSTAVAPIRLVVHLSLALILYAAILWTALSVRFPTPSASPAPSASPGLPRRLSGLTLGLVALTIVAGGFTAGLHAGLDYNTFPLMDGRLVPQGYALLEPFWRNLTQNIATVQFDHRLLATLTLLAASATVIVGLRRGLPIAPLLALAAAVGLQYALGVATLLNMVPVPLAVAHQTTAVLLLTAALVLRHSLRNRPAEVSA